MADIIVLVGKGPTLQDSTLVRAGGLPINGNQSLIQTSGNLQDVGYQNITEPKASSCDNLYTAVLRKIG